MLINANMCYTNGIEQSSEEAINSIKKYYFVKHIDYKDECEFRILYSNGNKEAAIDIKNKLVGIVISDRISEYNIHALQEYAKTYRINLFQINWNNRNISIGNK